MISRKSGSQDQPIAAIIRSSSKNRQTAVSCSKPILDPDQQSRRTDNQISGRVQPNAEELARYGVKVRDFAYESKLPPIVSFIYRQIQPGLESLRDDKHHVRRTRPLERVPTEPVADQHSPVNSQTAAHNLSQRRKRPTLHSTSFAPGVVDHYVSTSQSKSERSEADTPPTNSFRHDTPNIQTCNTQPVSISQYTDVMDSPISYSQLGFTDITPQIVDSQFIHDSSQLSPSRLRRAHSTIIRASPLQLSRRTPSLIGRTSSSQNLPTTARYFLRQRKPISYSIDTTTGRAKRRRMKRVAKDGKRRPRG